MPLVISRGLKGWPTSSVGFYLGARDPVHQYGSYWELIFDGNPAPYFANDIKTEIAYYVEILSTKL